ncbi:MAG: CARDB domain-containing protein, partial [Candidatus Thermoplasmatota archaeon]
AYDPATPEREGASPHESLSLRSLGATVPAGAFESGASRVLDVDLQLPRLVLIGPRAQPSSVEVGEPTHILATVANQGNATATAVRVMVSESTALANTVVGDVPPGQSRSVVLQASTVGMMGNRTLFVQAQGTNSDADPTGLRSQGVALLEVRPDPPPVIVSFRALPPAPAPHEPVALDVNATDDDGVTFVDFRWRDTSLHHANVTIGPPFRLIIGALTPGVPVDAWAVVGEANGQTTTTAHVTIAVASAGNATTTPSQTSTTSTPASPPPSGASRVNAALVPLGLCAAVLAAHFLRRRT